MDSSKPLSFFRDLKSRELNGFRVRKRPYFDAELPESRQTGAIVIEHNGDTSPPMAISFCKSTKSPHLLAVADEAGYISYYNTRLEFSSSTTFQENAEKARIVEWIAHENAIFDMCWIKEGSGLLTASGDQSIKLWDAQEKKCVRALMGHTGSVKTISSHPTNQDMVASGSRDGSFALWDLRCSENNANELCISSIATVREAHAPSNGRRVRRAKAAPTSITSVMYLRDEISIATAGAADSVVKFWDIRNLRRPFIQACPDSISYTPREKGLHGISSLSQDLNGVYISASCTDSRIYLYNILQLEKGPVKTFSGGRIGSFFVKSAISPDAAHILGGSGDGNAYIWQVNKPEADPLTLKSHDSEVTSVDWCPYEMGKLATCSDDFTVRFWKIQSSCYSNTRSPSSIRRRVMGPPSSERKKLLFQDEELTFTMNKSDSSCSDVSSHITSPSKPIVSYLCTPESLKKKQCSLGVKENLEKTPEVATGSPSSVLNPPSSLRRRTIRDYFMAIS